MRIFSQSSSVTRVTEKRTSVPSGSAFQSPGLLHAPLRYIVRFFNLGYDVYNVFLDRLVLWTGGKLDYRLEGSLPLLYDRLRHL
jgi:hypothetical protein